MQFTDIDDFLDGILPQVPGCPIYTARDYVRRAAIDFCKETGVSVETTPEIDLEAGEAILQLPTPGSDVRVWQLLWMKTTTHPVVPLDRRALTERGARWEGLSGSRPLNYVRENNSDVLLIPTPSDDLLAELTVQCSYIPTDDATNLDKVLFDEYREAIEDGALARLLRMSKTAWYDPAEARERKFDFGVAMSSARALAAKDFQTGELRAQMFPLA